MDNYDEEELDLKIHDAWAKEKDGDQFRDTYEWLVSWDYFKAGYLAGMAAHLQAKKSPMEEAVEGKRA